MTPECLRPALASACTICINFSWKEQRVDLSNMESTAHLRNRNALS